MSENEKEKQLQPKEEPVEIDGWFLEKTASGPIISEEDLAGTSSLEKSFLRCPRCGSENAVNTCYRHESYGTNISGFDEYKVEIKCLQCGSYSLYRSTDSFGPTG